MFSSALPFHVRLYGYSFTSAGHSTYIPGSTSRMSTKTRQIVSDTHTDGGGRNAVLSLRLSSHSLYLMWAEGWNLVTPPNEQKIIPRTHGDGEDLSGTLCCWHFCPCSGFKGRDKDELGDRESVQGHSRLSHLGGYVFLCLFFPGEMTASAVC